MRTPIALLATLALATAGFSAPNSFEGKIDFLQTEGRKSTPLSYLFKGDLMRIEMKEGNEEFAMIINMAEKETIMIMAEEEMYMVMKLDDLPEVAQRESKSVKTGRSEKILGYDCDEYTVTEGKTVTEYWGAKGLGVFRGMKKGGPGTSTTPSLWEIEAQKSGLFPLRIIERNAKGKEMSRMEATGVEPGKLADSLFAPPKGYQKFEMPNFGKMFGG